MKTILRSFLPSLIFVICLYANRIQAQTDASISVTVNPPYTGDLSVWRSDPSRVLIILTGGNSPTTVRISGYATNSDNSIRIETKDDIPAQQRIDLREHEVRTLSGQYLSLTDPNSVRYIGTNAATIARSGQLPEGNYRLCLKLLNYNAPHAQLSNESCSNFTITYLDPPNTIQPTCGDVLSSNPPQSITFLWSRLTQPTVTYDFILREVPIGHTANEVFHSGSGLILDRPLNGQSSFVYSASEPPLTVGRTYAWAIRAADPSGTSQIRNHGLSEICSFTYGSSSSSGSCNHPSVTIAYPPDASVVPYRYVPVIIHFDPYCDDYHRFASTFSIGGATESPRNLTWLPNPLSAQRASAGSITQEQAQYIWIGSHNGVPYPPGVSQSWNGTVQLTLGTTALPTASLTGHFTTGMGPSRLTYPANDTTVSSGDEVHFVWRTADAPSEDALKPRFDIVQSTHQASSAYNLTVHERWVLEVSRTRDMSSPVYTTNGVVDISDISAMNAAAISAAIYISARASHSFTENGDYYWRLKWLVNTSDPTSPESYSPSDVRHFTIGAGSTPSASDCLSILPASPAVGDTWTATLKPRFSVLVRPGINVSSVTGGRLQVWRRASSTESSSTSTGSAEVLDVSFTGNEAAKFRPRSGTPGSYDLAFVNETSSPNQWSATDHAQYLWRFTLRFTGSSIRTDRVTCSRSEVTSSDGTFSVEQSTHADSSGCQDNCSAPDVTDHTATSSTFNAGDDLHLGRFTLHLVTATGTGSSLSGTGTIAIPFLHNIRLAVDFSGLHVNAAHEVFDGTAHGHWDNSSPLPDLTGAGTALHLTQDQINGISAASAQPARLLSQLVTGSPISLPIGIDTTVGGMQIVLGVTALDFDAHNGQLTAVASIPLPMLGPGMGIGVGAKNICLNPNGFGGDGNFKLFAPTDIGYTHDDNIVGFAIKGCTQDEHHAYQDDGTYMTFDCHGFKNLHFVTDVTFPRSSILPILPTGDVDPNGDHKVIAGFSILVERNYLNAHHSSWGFMATGTMGRFAATSAPDLVFTVDSLVLDLSDDTNPDGIIFPAGFTGTHDNTWRGFYMKELSCALPSRFSTFDHRPITFAVRNVIIDMTTGITASFRIENLISSSPNVNMASWGATIDTIGLDLVCNSFRRAFMAGRLKTPISTTLLGYSATLSHPPSGFQFDMVVHPVTNLEASLWAATLTLLPTTNITFTAGGGHGAEISARFDGSITIAGDIHSPGGGQSVPGMDFRGISFEGVVISSEESHMNSGTWHMSSQQHGAAGFPLSLDSVPSLVVGQRDGLPALGLRFHVSLNLQSGSNGVSGGTGISIWAKLGTDARGAAQFQFGGISIDEINLGCRIGSTIEIYGTIALYDHDATYGNGFLGAIRATILGKITIDASVRFGSVTHGADTNRYWYVDANVGFPAITFMTGLAFYGFGGGACYHMRRVGDLGHLSSAPHSSREMANQYVPDATQGFGFHAKVVIGTIPTADVFNADITLEVQFLAAGGVGSITLRGDGYLLAGLNDRAAAPVSAHVRISYDFPTSTLDGRLAVAVGSPYNTFVNILSSDSVIVFHVDPGTWYFHMGLPPMDQRIGVQIGLGPVNVVFNTYLDAGMNIPAAELPQDIVDKIHPPPITRSPSVGLGSGFAFGTYFHAGFNGSCLIFYGDLSITLGFDISFLNYGASAYCAETHDHIGMNGWYARGDIYADIHAELGVDVGFGRARIMSFDVGAVLAGAAPNPSWAAGAIETDYYLLGIQGHCHFDFTVGYPCTLVPSPRESAVATIPLIGQVSPDSAATEVDIFTAPQAAFNYAIDHSFTLPEMTARGEDVIRTYRIHLMSFTLSEGATTMSVASDGTNATLTPTNALQGHHGYTVTVRVAAQVLSGSSWIQANHLDGTPITETIIHPFTTGAPPDHINASNVAFTYPMDRQSHFLQGECSEGIVLLKIGQPYLFDIPAGVRRTSFIARFTPKDESADPVNTDVTYDTGAVHFQIPALQNNTIYALQIIKKQTAASPGFSLSGIQTSLASTILSGRVSRYANGSSIAFAHRDLRNIGVGAGEKQLYLYYFKTSQFNRLQQKLDSWTPSSTISPRAFGTLEIHTAQFTGPELLDDYEMNGTSYERHGHVTIPPLVHVAANQRVDEWHRTFTNPWVYDAFSRLVRMNLRSSSTRTNFDREALNGTRGSGAALANYIGISDPLVSDNEIQPPPSSGPVFKLGSSSGGSRGIGRTGISPHSRTVPPPTVQISFNQGIVVPMDFGSLRNQVAYILSVYSSEFFSREDYSWLQQVHSKRYEMMSHGSYTLGFNYWYSGCIPEPDTGTPTYRKQFTY